MISRLRDIDETATSSHPAGPRVEVVSPESIDAWLGVLSTLLHMPEARRQAIRDELSEHLYQRCRELVLAGMTQADAVQQAVGELGETAELARRLDQAHRLPKRRVIMNLSMLGIGAAVVSATVFTMSGRDPIAQPSVFEDLASQRTPPASAAKERIQITEEMTLGELLALVGESHDGAMLVDWAALNAIGYVPDDHLDWVAQELPIPRVLAALARVDDADSIDWRYGEAGLEVSTREALDRREVTLASYDIRDMMDTAGVSEDEVTNLLLTFVSPDDWEDNGGNLARSRIVGGRLFIEAPPRIHTRAQWILGELAAGEDLGAVLDPRDPGDARPRAVGVLAPGDVLTVEVYELFAAGEWYTATRRIEADGTLRLPYVGEFPAAGMRTRDVERALTERAADLLEHPIVSVYAALEDRAPEAGTAYAAPGAGRAAGVGGPGAPGIGGGVGGGGATGGGGGTGGSGVSR